MPANTTTYNALTLGIYNFMLQVGPQGLSLPPYYGSTLRGAFGGAFKQIACAALQRESCHNCKLESSCPYAYVFETTAPAQAQKLAGYDDVPRPFMFIPKLQDKTSYTPGESLLVELRLFGRGNDYFPYFVLAFIRMGERGLGFQRQPFRLTQVTLVNPFSMVEQQVYDGGTNKVFSPRYLLTGDQIFGRSFNRFFQPEAQRRNLDLTAATESKSLSASSTAAIGLTQEAVDPNANGEQADCLSVFSSPVNGEALARKETDGNTLTRNDSAGTAKPMRVKVNYLTPVRIKEDGKLATTIEFHHLARSLVRRASSLMYFHHGVDLQLDYSGLSEASRQVQRVSDKTRWYDIERFSQRQGGKMKLGGVVGEVTYEGDLAEFLPLLEFGRWCGAGKNCVFGLGQMDYVFVE